LDVHTRQQRSHNMAAIKSNWTKPEKEVAAWLKNQRILFESHVSSLPGTPDFVFPGDKVALLIHGCFWHGHDCPLFVWPKTRQKFWSAKIMGNRIRDTKVRGELRDLGWKVEVIWECQLKANADHWLLRFVDRFGLEATIAKRSFYLQPLFQN